MKRKSNSNKLLILVSVFLLNLAPANVFAQTYPYFCGFETEDDMVGWKFASLNKGNKWVRGEATASKGTYSLYVSSDNGAKASYSNSSCAIAVYKEFDLPDDNNYEISFDWKAVGESNSDAIYVGWITSSTTITANTTGIDPLIGYYIKDTLNSSSSWQNHVMKVKGGKKGRLFFYWVNNGSISNPPGGCIDNLQIGSVAACDSPKDLSFSNILGTGITLSWEGNAAEYEIMYKNINTDDWKSITQIHTNSVLLSDISEGVYNFWVRSICGNDTSIWSAEQNYIITEGFVNCLNFTDLKNKNTVVARYGTYDNPDANVGLKDFGEESIFSRHTINMIPNRYDKNTGKTDPNVRLKTIPDGSFVSIRLGNEIKNSEAESLTYDYYVDPKSSIVLMKYAVVFQDPKHNRDHQPKFTIEILNDKGKPIDPTCGSVNFVADRNAPGWHTEGSENDVIIWKDWTTIGLNVMDYRGKNIKIKLTTYDCQEGTLFLIIQLLYSSL